MQYRIAENGKSKFFICAHRYEDETVRFAASELQKYLLQATGAVVPYFSDRCKEVGVALNGCPRAMEFIEGVPSTEEDYSTEYVD